MPSFNLIDKPWIPCIDLQGRSMELGIRDALVRAHELRELFDPSPLVTVALHRLLLAVLHRSLMGPSGLSEWVSLWNQGRWNPDTITSYLERWRSRFDLFDPLHPFYQLPFPSNLADPSKHQPVTILMQEAAAGNNPTVFDHRFDDDPAPLSSAEVARYLVAHQAYALGGGVSFPFNLCHSTLVRGYTVLALGESLFETLALNLLPYNAERPIPWLDEDVATWEQNEPRIPDPHGTPPRGYVDYLTWQSRRILLIPESDPPKVRWCLRLQHLKPVDTIRDPFKCYVRTKDGGFMPKRLEPERALWRDSHILFQFGIPDRERPEVFNWLSRLELQRQSGRIPMKSAYQFFMAGMALDEKKAANVIFWRREYLPLPLVYLANKTLTDYLQSALHLAEQVARALKQSTRSFASLLLPQLPNNQSQKKREGQDVEDANLAKHLAPERYYWNRLENPFKRLLVDLPTARESYEASAPDFKPQELIAWSQHVKHAAMSAFEESVWAAGTSARTLKAATIAERQLQHAIEQALQTVILQRRI